MAGAIVPSDINAPLVSHCVSWPDGEEWKALLYGSLTRLINPDLWDSNTGNVDAAAMRVLEAFYAVREGVSCAMIGEIKLWPSNTIPDGWLLCDGTAFAPSDYPELFDLIGFTYGGVHPDAFRVPDLQGRVPVGQKPGDADFNSLGGIGGEKTHTLTVEGMPQHNHTWTTRAGGSSQSVIYTTTTSPGSTVRFMSGPAGGTEVTQNPFIRNAGGGEAHNNLQPFQVLNYIIYAGVIS